MSDEEILLGIKVAYEVLRELRARLPQSDWHAAFETILRLAAHGRKDIEIRAEVELGYAPPRADYMVLFKNGDEGLAGDAFALFKDINVIEYKRPSDAVNLRAVFKAIGYAQLLFGNAANEDDIPLDQVTVSLFHTGKAPQVLKTLQDMGVRVRSTVSGVYLVEGLSYFPVQIVAMQGLKGKENAIFRALSDHAKAADLRTITDDMKDASDDELEMWRTYMKPVAEKNAGLFAELKKEDKGMSSVLVDIMKDEVDELVNAATARAAAEAAAEADATLAHSVGSLMAAMGMGIDEAMDALDIPEDKRAEVAALIGKDRD